MFHLEDRWSLRTMASCFSWVCCRRISSFACGPPCKSQTKGGLNETAAKDSLCCLAILLMELYYLTVALNHTLSELGAETGELIHVFAELHDVGSVAVRYPSHCIVPGFGLLLGRGARRGPKTHGALCISDLLMLVMLQQQRDRRHPAEVLNVVATVRHCGVRSLICVRLIHLGCSVDAACAARCGIDRSLVCWTQRTSDF